MSNNNAAALEEFVADATAVLSETEENLQKLAQVALTRYQHLHGRGRQEQTAQRLQQIGKQLTKLSERSKTLNAYLQNGLDAPPTDDSDWPRIRILQSQEEQRSQLARELEESVGQLLANAVFELASCQHLLASDTQAVSDGLSALQQELEQGLADIRHFITDLEPSAILSNFGLGGGIRRYLEQFEVRTNIEASLQINTNIGRLPNIIEVTIFRIIQEALQNVEQHANATHVKVECKETEGALEFSIIDNGHGLALNQIDVTKRKLGLARMVDYAELLDGQLRVFSEQEQGTKLVLSIPYQTL